MIVELPKISIEEYEAFRKRYYTKPGISEMELQLREFQKKILLEQDYSVLPEFRKQLAIYAKSILLKLVKGTSDYIEPAIVEELAEIAAENFIKRYFRNDEPIVGVSFAGILIFKVREVRSIYLKTKSLESALSLDVVYGDEDSNNALSVESKLSFKDFVETEDETEKLEDYKEKILENIKAECKLLDQIPNKKGLSRKFLQYLIYITLLQKEKNDRKINVIANQAIKLVESDEQKLVELTPILESAFLDLQVA